jgi:hypothetical protein
MGTVGRYALSGGLIGAARFGIPKSYIGEKGRERYSKKQRIIRGVLGGVSGAATGAYLGHAMNTLPDKVKAIARRGQELPSINKGPKLTGFIPPKWTRHFSNKINVENKIPKSPAIKVVTKPGAEDLQEVIQSRKGLMKNASINLGAFFDELSKIGW